MKWNDDGQWHDITAQQLNSYIEESSYRIPLSPLQDILTCIERAGQMQYKVFKGRCPVVEQGRAPGGELYLILEGNGFLLTTHQHFNVLEASFRNCLQNGTATIGDIRTYGDNLGRFLLCPGDIIGEYEFST